MKFGSYRDLRRRDERELIVPAEGVDASLTILESCLAQAGWSADLVAANPAA